MWAYFSKVKSSIVWPLFWYQRYHQQWEIFASEMTFLLNCNETQWIFKKLYVIFVLCYERTSSNARFIHCSPQRGFITSNSDTFSVSLCVSCYRSTETFRYYVRPRLKFSLRNIYSVLVHICLFEIMSAFYNPPNSYFRCDTGSACSRIKTGLLIK